MSDYPLETADAASLGFAARPLAALDRLIEGHIADGRYPGAQIALARHGKLALFKSFGNARVAPETIPAGKDTLFLVFSQTKVLTMAAIWSLVEEGLLSFSDRVADHLPEFAARGKGEITIHQVATHQAGFPSSRITRAAWLDHARMRAEVCDFSLEWAPGSQLQYHGHAAHQVLAMVMEAITGQDFRQVIRERVIAPLGLGHDIVAGVPPELQHRCADIHAPDGAEAPGDNTSEFRSAGLPHGGGFATARGLAAFYQMMLNGGSLNGVRLFSPRMIAYVTKNATGERPDLAMSGIPMHRGLGPHVRGESDRIRGLGLIAAPGTFGHGGVGTSYSWADPSSGVSFTYVANFISPEPWHSMRLDRVSNLVHAAID